MHETAPFRQKYIDDNRSNKLYYTFFLFYTVNVSFYLFFTCLLTVSLYILYIVNIS